ncbi:MAG: adenylyltransferase/cytidyltransferase family protein [Thermomicrobiales bacterium]
MNNSIPLNCSRLGLLGGSFDPIHVGHLIVAEILAYSLDIDHVVFIPAAHPPHKLAQSLAPADSRLDMIRPRSKARRTFQSVRSTCVARALPTPQTPWPRSATAYPNAPKCIS